jgi:hypothetical protein
MNVSFSRKKSTKAVEGRDMRQPFELFDILVLYRVLLIH